MPRRARNLLEPRYSSALGRGRGLPLEPLEPRCWWRPSLSATRSQDEPQQRLLNWGVAGREAFAGVYFKRNTGGPVRPVADDQWRTALLQLPNSGRGQWEEDNGERNWIWIGRSKPLVDIAKHDTVDAQAYELADFVIGALIAALAVHP